MRRTLAALALALIASPAFAQAPAPAPAPAPKPAATKKAPAKGQFCPKAMSGQDSPDGKLTCKPDKKGKLRWDNK
jgi:hypothetical protein